EPVTALLVALEVMILFAGVVSRYVLHSPLTWSDELASILFLWLAMLGAVIALRRSEHMRLTAVAGRLPQQARRVLETIAALVVIVFVLLIILPAWRYGEEEWAIITPALSIHNSWRASALVVGAVLMAVIALAQLVARASRWEICLGLGIVFCVAAALWLARPALLAIGNYNLVVFFVLLVAAEVASGVPIAF